LSRKRHTMKRIALVLIALMFTIPAFAQTAKVKPPIPVRAVVSPDLKQTLRAAADPASTIADIRGYIHDGRVQIHTAKDREVFNDLVNFVQSTEDAGVKASDASKDAEAASHWKSLADNWTVKAKEPYLLSYCTDHKEITTWTGNKRVEGVHTYCEYEHPLSAGGVHKIWDVCDVKPDDLVQADKASESATNAEKLSEDEAAEGKIELQKAGAYYAALRTGIGLPTLP
jgi:hypothetical protein